MRIASTRSGRTINLFFSAPCTREPVSRSACWRHTGIPPQHLQRSLTKWASGDLKGWMPFPPQRARRPGDFMLALGNKNSRTCFSANSSDLWAGKEARGFLSLAIVVYFFSKEEPETQRDQESYLYIQAMLAGQDRTLRWTQLPVPLMSSSFFASQISVQTSQSDISVIFSVTPLPAESQGWLDLVSFLHLPLFIRNPIVPLLHFLYYTAFPPRTGSQISS